jgi:murein DD-endopeptidase MepM/ murein hydrolase activator NlpD
MPIGVLPLMSRARAALVIMVGSASMAFALALPDATAQQVPPESTTTTVPADSPASTTTTTTTPVIDPNGDAPRETVPQVDVTVPPRQRDPSVQGRTAELTQPRERVVRVDVRKARTSSLAAQAELETAIAKRAELESQLAALQEQVSTLDTVSSQAMRDLSAARDELADRAADAYMRGPYSEDRSSVPETDFQMLRVALFDAMVRAEDATVVRFRDAKARVTTEHQRTVATIAATQAALAQARVDEQQARIDAKSASFAFAVSSAGGDLVIHGFVFPVARPHAFGDTFGDPRMPGTELEHAHEGADIGATEGTELYACERGVIMMLPSGGLGGTGIFLKGESGAVYYYAHLSRYADALAAGKVVEAGELVGYVGSTGNATTGPHLHFEVHPDGGEAINPYPILTAADTV